MSETLPEEQRKIIQQTVKDTLLQLGVNVDTPEDVVEWQQDLHHLRRWRKAVNAVESKTVWVVISTLIAGVLAAAWLGVQSFIKGNGQMG